MLTGHSSYIDAVVQVKSNIDSGMFKGIQDAAIEALQIDSSWHHQQNGIYKHRRTLVQGMMDLLGCTYDTDTAGLFVWAKVKEGIDTLQFTDHILKEARVFIVPGEVFGTQGSNYVRASLCVPQERIKEAISRINKTKIELKA